MSATKMNHTESYFATDDDFNKLYPLPIQKLARQHWSPMNIAKLAAVFLAGDSHASILDIGSGVGKFCLIGAYETPWAHYYGIEQRQRLVVHANHAKHALRLRNVSFLHGNITQLDLGNYDHFYFYNAFFENISCGEKIDENIGHSLELFTQYSRHLYTQLDRRMPGTRLCTLCTTESEIPPSYLLVDDQLNQLLKFWVKI